MSHHARVAQDVADVRYGDAPFDSRSPGDVILCSSDDVHFRAYKNVLSLASPFFAGMFTLPQGGTSTQPSPPPQLDVVHLSENARAIDVMLRACYPVRRPKLSDFDEARMALELSRKYDMEALQELTEDGLAAMIPSNPVSIYALASHYGLVDLVGRAAASTNVLQSLYCDDLQLVDGRQFHLLVRYRQRCSDAAINVARTSTWFTTFPASIFQATAMQYPSPCNCFPADSPRTKIVSRSGTTYRATHWWWRYIEQAKTALKDLPCGKAVLEPVLLKGIMEEARACCNCKARMDGNQECLRNFAQVFAEEIDKAVAQVPFSFQNA